MPLTRPGRADGARPRAVRRAPVLLLAAACAVPALVPAAASAAPAFRLARSDVALQIDRGVLGSWSALTARRGAAIGFEQGSAGRKVLRLADAPGAGGYVAVTKPFSPQTVINVQTEAALVRQHLRRGKVRALIAVTGRDGSSYQAGVYRAPAGHLRWAVWAKGASGGVRDLRVATLARLGAFHRLALSTRWGGARSRAILSVDGRAVARTPLQKRATAGTRAIIGLGRVSKMNETGSMLVRSGRVTAAAPTAIASSRRRPRDRGRPTSSPARRSSGAISRPGGLSQWGGLQRVATDRISASGPRSARGPSRHGSRSATATIRSGSATAPRCSPRPASPRGTTAGTRGARCSRPTTRPPRGGR